MTNTLFYGDNLDVMQKHLADASVDLVYLDPPFNSNRDYNVLFKEQSGADSPAQIKAFGDTWRWANAALDWENFPELCPNPRVQDLMEGFLKMLGHNDVSAYLVMMAPRLYHLHRVLKPTGSLYLHCDPTASHYLKLLCDAIFGPKNLKNEISTVVIMMSGRDRAILDVCMILCCFTQKELQRFGTRSICHYGRSILMKLIAWRNKEQGDVL